MGGAGALKSPRQWSQGSAPHPPEPIPVHDRLPVVLQHGCGIVHKGPKFLLHIQEWQPSLQVSDLLPDEEQLVLALCKSWGHADILSCCPGPAGQRGLRKNRKGAVMAKDDIGMMAPGDSQGLQGRPPGRNGLRREEGILEEGEVSTQSLAYLPPLLGTALAPCQGPCPALC